MNDANSKREKPNWKCKGNNASIGCEHDENASKLIIGRDNAQRIRVKVHPIRNNANMSVHSPHPLLVCALRGNHDIQYICNKSGGAEYITKYISKAVQKQSYLNVFFKAT